MAKVIARTGTAAGVQVRKAPAKRLTKGQLEKFLAALAQTCNVTASCAKAKVSSTAIYRQRAKSEPFAKAWEQAIRDGYGRLELMLLESAIAAYAVPDATEIEAAPRPRMSEPNILRLLQLHRQQVAAIRAAEAAAGQDAGQDKGQQDERADDDAGALAELEAKLLQMHERLTADDG